MLATDEPGPSGQHTALATDATTNRSRKSGRTSAKASALGISPSQSDQAAVDEDNKQSHTADKQRAEEEERAGQSADAELEDEDDHINSEGKSLDELAVRFSQATKELQASCDHDAQAVNRCLSVRSCVLHM